jgi:POT family proton-dependent oligopeptide transporter
MAFGLVQYVLGKKRLQPALDRLAAEPKPAAAAAVGRPAEPRGETAAGGFSAAEWKRLAAVVVFFLFASLFWGAYEQAGSTLNLFADRHTRLEVAGVEFPSSWFQSVQPIFVILLAPAFAWLWIRLGPHEPSSPAKFALGLFFMGLAFLVLVPAGSAVDETTGLRVSPWWLVLAYFVSVLGELCLSPVGLSVVTKLSPARIVGLAMGIWFLSNALGNKLAGWAAGFIATLPLASLFGWVAAVTLVSALLLFAIVRPVRGLMGGVR